MYPHKKAPIKKELAQHSRAPAAQGSNVLQKYKNRLEKALTGNAVLDKKVEAHGENILGLKKEIDGLNRVIYEHKKWDEKNKVLPQEVEADNGLLKKNLAETEKDEVDEFKGEKGRGGSGKKVKEEDKRLQRNKKGNERMTEVKTKEAALLEEAEDNKAGQTHLSFVMTKGNEI